MTLSFSDHGGGTRLVLDHGSFATRLDTSCTKRAGRRHWTGSRSIWRKQ